MFETEVELVVVRGLQGAGGEGIQADGQRTGWSTWLDAGARRTAGAKDRLKRLVGADRSIDGAAGHIRSNANASNLSGKTAGEAGIVRSIHQTAVGDLLRDDVVEDAESPMNSSVRSKLICNRGARLVDEQRRCRKQVVNICREPPDSAADWSRAKHRGTNRPCARREPADW